MYKDLDNQIRLINDTRPDLKVIPPFFWDESGRATIHGIITTSLKLTGDNIMTMMMFDPDLAHAIHQWIVDAYIILVHHFADHRKSACDLSTCGRMCWHNDFF